MPGKYGSGLSFNGATNADGHDNKFSELDINNRDDPGSLGEATANSNRRCVITKETTGDNARAIHSGSNSGTPGFWAQVNNQTFSATSSALSLNTWTHLAGTFDGTTMRFYKNGILAMSQPASGSLTVTSNAIYIGGNTVFGVVFQRLNRRSPDLQSCPHGNRSSDRHEHANPIA